MNLGERINKEFILEIVDQRDGFIVFNKPAGLVTHPTRKNDKQVSLLDTLVDLYPEVLFWGEELRQGIVHRLDKVTSGLIVCAYDQNTFTELKNEFATRSVKKSYFAVVENPVSSNKGVIDAPIGPDPRSKAKQKVVKNGRNATTEYKVISYVDDLSILSVGLVTGRKHQIRTHLAYLGNPILNDKIYGAKFPNEIPPYAIALHSYKLEFKHNNREFSYQIDPPEYIEKLYN